MFSEAEANKLDRLIDAITLKGLLVEITESLTTRSVYLLVRFHLNHYPQVKVRISDHAGNPQRLAACKVDLDLRLEELPSSKKPYFYSDLAQRITNILMSRWVNPRKRRACAALYTDAKKAPKSKKAMLEKHQAKRTKPKNKKQGET